MSRGFAGSWKPRPAAPRRVRNGIRLRGGDDSPGRTWVAGRWVSLMEQVIAAKERTEGLEYARLGQTTELRLEPGVVLASVQGRASRPYRTRWTIPPFPAEQWRLLIDAMAGEAIYSAKLLSGELPPSFEPLLASVGLELLPQAGDLSTSCGCGAPRCKHADADAWLVAQRLDDEPLAILGLRGMEAPQLLEKLSAARARRAPGIASAHAEAVMGRPSAEDDGLEPDPDAFWRPGPELSDLQRMPPPHHAPHALLRRLGPSPLPGRFPTVGLLASVYDEVSRSAIRLRDRAEGIAGSELDL